MDAAACCFDLHWLLFAEIVGWMFCWLKFCIVVYTFVYDCLAILRGSLGVLVVACFRGEHVYCLVLLCW